MPIARLATRTGRTLMLPPANLGEAILAGANRVTLAGSIEEAVHWLAGERETFAPAPWHDTEPKLRLEDIAGHRAAKRALTIAAAGRHDVLITTARNAPAVGLARRLPTMMAEPTAEERHEALAIHSVAGLLDPTGRHVEKRPLRAPHWSASPGAIGREPEGNRRKRPQPGEAALAHAGVLLLDEIDRFDRQTLERVRQHVTGHDRCDTTYPRDFVLIGILVTDDEPPDTLSTEARQQAAGAALDRTGTADLFDIAFDIEPAGRVQAEADGHATSATISKACTRVRTALEANDTGACAELSAGAAALLHASATRYGDDAAWRIRAVATTIAHLEAQGIAAQVHETHVREAAALRGILDHR